MNKKFMNDNLFDELIESIREGGAILRGEKRPSRSFIVETPDVHHIREGFQSLHDELTILSESNDQTLHGFEQDQAK